jgi:hypothetical protein
LVFQADGSFFIKESGFSTRTWTSTTLHTVNPEEIITAFNLLF